MTTLPGGTQPPAPDPTSVPDPEVELKRRELSLTKVSVISSAAVAVASVVITFVVTLISTSSDKQLSAEAFRHEQQITAYSDFLTSTDTFFGALEEYNSHDSDCIVGDLPSSESLVLAHDDLVLKHNVVRIVATEATVAAADKLEEYIASLVETAITHCERRQEPGSTVSLTGVAFDIEINGLKQGFSNAARADLGFD